MEKGKKNKIKYWQKLSDILLHKYVHRRMTYTIEYFFLLILYFELLIYYKNDCSIAT